MGFSQSSGVGAVPSNMGRALGMVGALTLGYAALWLVGPGADMGLSRYLPLHTAMETLAIVIAMLTFGIAWNAHADARPGNVMIIAMALFGTALLDFGHTLSYLGMPEFVTPSAPQKAIVFWLAARYLVAFGLVATVLRASAVPLSNRVRYGLLAVVLVYVGLVYRYALFDPGLVPEFFIVGQGLTALKVNLEYGLVLLYAGSALIAFLAAWEGKKEQGAWIFAGAAVAALSELCFTLYSSVSDVFNLAGHVYKILSYLIIYRIVFVRSVSQPFTALEESLRRERGLAAEHSSFVRTLNMLEEAVLKASAEGRIVSANQGWWNLAGLEPQPGMLLLDSIHEDDRPAVSALLHSLVTGEKDEFRGRFRFAGQGHASAWIECRFVAERESNGEFLSARGVLRDITKTYLQERHIAHMAMHDALTNLPNRILLEDRIKKAIQMAERHQQHVAVCFIDLDHFKNINDAYGHKAGDALLKTLAGKLDDSLRVGDTLARWGGDEFVILLPDLPGTDALRQVAHKLVEVMRQTFDLEGQAVTATFSMGIAVYPEDGNSVDELLARADRAMFYAKSQGRNNFQMFSDMSSKGLGKKELYVQTRLAQAIREERIDVWFQPLVAAGLDEGGIARLAGVEALARWHDPDLGWISPASFIPMAENLGLIGELSDLVRRLALQRFQPWLAARPELHLAINVSKRQLFAQGFTEALVEDVTRYGVPVSAIILEVTESVALMDVEFAEARLQQLAAAGFELSIDDFGTGYASLSQLHDLPVKELKIDISFVRRVHTADGLRLVQAILSLAQALNLRTVAEGIEDEATADLLRGLGVNLLQGYFFGKPMPAPDLETMPLFVGA